MNDLSEKTYFDDTVNIKAKLSDISRQLVYEYLKCISINLHSGASNTRVY